MTAENIQSSFWYIENEILFHFIVKTKTRIWRFEKQENIWTWLPLISKYEILIVEVLRLMMIRK